ncbi:anthranilate synthase [gamma proteobacterium HTCC5015]|nr:anthranilate synthase [gamma proteobacterium HTCC5015]
MPLPASDDSLDLLGLQQLSSERYPALLSSTSEQTPSQVQAQHNSRYDILMAFPESQRLELRAEDVASGRADDFLQRLDREFQAHCCDEEDTGWPFRGGWFVYLSYELAQQVEPSLQLPLADNQLIAYAQRVRSAVVVDRVRGEAWWLCESDLPAAEQEKRWKQLQIDCQALKALQAQGSVSLQSLVEQEAAHYRRWVEKTLNYIKEGDVFQVNLSRPWRAQLAGELTSCQLFAELRRQNPSPFAACVHAADFDVISSSPERLVSVRAGRVDTRPIAGTRPRLDVKDDAKVTRELLGHPKERSEHIMLIDLERNDLGRICQPGSVTVDELMVLESYAHVHHIVSNVSGQLREGVSPGEVIRAVFPGGTITGCPKVRCMEILSELEAEPRGAYTGSLGYINRNGDMDFNILIRTIERHGDQLTFRAGGGIVADSEAEKELEETRAKARGLLKVFQGH